MNTFKLHYGISEIDVLQWEKLLEDSSVASFFQAPSCYRFYDSLSFLKPFVFGVSEDGSLKGIMCGYIIADGGRLKRFFSRRAIIPGGALLADNISNEALFLLLKQTKTYLEGKAIYIELRNYNNYISYRECFEKVGFSYQAHLNFHVETLDAESALKQLSSTKRRDIKLSKKEGAEIIEIKEEKDLKEYYDILKDLYETKIKTSLFPYEFFEKLGKLPEGKIFGIKYQENIIGGSVCVLLKNKTVYEWFVCGLDGKFKNIYPSTLATWADIEYAAENNFKYFDMMGAGKPDEGYGVREFKAKFGGELVEHGRFLYITKPFMYKIGKKAIMLIKRN
ncbi:peptidoglycan bridge formation glycyltransferase FemA/FemB family protein [Paludibacter sp. 221]|uniref:lipid II:glycine glycyltransferase FemX n=1 Tax=Paludibacter sp. 221 TaxID=2302939 RepID=UPI0013D25B92|nr:peptidoglycan bridge formation glycyltransferase FemA/FemB family protein [Paludibacter sp. 221]NDV46040.1 peptidoglycan bridge formation glycyltransferase FemA/FemB family protein [Paludibacter sp. 221]